MYGNKQAGEGASWSSLFQKFYQIQVFYNVKHKKSKVLPLNKEAIWK